MSISALYFLRIIVIFSLSVSQRKSFRYVYSQGRFSAEYAAYWPAGLS